ncbi:MAG: hypothetical protein IT559_02935 [Alphaproteobacteria bacterium]|nr:hypothetical protein [Alphaproteobacteria bacterium]
MAQDLNKKTIRLIFDRESHCESVTNYINNAAHTHWGVDVVERDPNENAVAIRFNESNIFNHTDLLKAASLTHTNVAVEEIQETPAQPDTAAFAIP